METQAKIRTWGLELARIFTPEFYPGLIRLIIGILIVAMCLWMGLGILDILHGLRGVFTQDWSQVAERAIISALVILAFLEVIRTLQSYLVLGRVRLTFILDTALVVLITELMGLWFREYAPQKVLLGLGVIVVLVILRLLTARFPPESS